MDKSRIHYKDFIIWPVTDDRGRHYCEVSDSHSSEVHVTDEFTSWQTAEISAKNWIDKQKKPA